MIRQDGEALSVEGPVNLQTVPELITQAAGLLHDGVRRIDFSGVTEVDSSAVAFALELQRQAGRAAGARVVLQNLPEAMRNLSRLYGVSELLEGGAG